MYLSNCTNGNNDEGIQKERRVMNVNFTLKVSHMLSLIEFLLFVAFLIAIKGTFYSVRTRGICLSVTQQMSIRNNLNNREHNNVTTIEVKYSQHYYIISHINS